MKWMIGDSRFRELIWMRGIALGHTLFVETPTKSVDSYSCWQRRSITWIRKRTLSYCNSRVKGHLQSREGSLLGSGRPQNPQRPTYSLRNVSDRNEEIGGLASESTKGTGCGGGCMWCGSWWLRCPEVRKRSQLLSI